MQYKQRELVATLNDFYHRPVAKVSLELFLSVSLILILGIFAIQPTLVTMATLNKEITEKKELDKTLTIKIASLNSAQTTYYASQEKLALLDESIPSHPKLIYTLKILEKLATENNIVLRSINVSEIPSEIETTETFKDLTRSSVAVSVSVKGDYVSIKNFVQELINSRRSLVVESVTFNLEESRNAESLGASITLDIPYFGN